jgi:hypothetical protein
MNKERAKEILQQLNSAKNMYSVMTPDEIDEIWAITKTNLHSTLCTIVNNGAVPIIMHQFIENWHRNGKAKLVVDEQNRREYIYLDVRYFCRKNPINGEWVTYDAVLEQSNKIEAKESVSRGFQVFLSVLAIWMASLN